MLINYLAELVPSSARSTSSSAAPLPHQFGPLLSDTLDKVKDVIGKVLPVNKKLTALEEAEWEEESEEGALEREMMNQCWFFFSFRNSVLTTY
jgi:ATPase family AAA domain-containing protein 2